MRVEGTGAAVGGRLLVARLNDLVDGAVMNYARDLEKIGYAQR